MKERKDRLRKRLHLSLIISLIIAVFMAVIISFAKAASDFSWVVSGDMAIKTTPVTFLQRLVTFLISFVIVFLISVWVMSKLYKKDPIWTDPQHPNRELSDAGIYGTSKYEQPREYRSLAQIRPIEDCHGLILGQLDDKARECIDYYPDPHDPTAHTNMNIFAIGASGSGKTFTFGKNYCYQAIKTGHSIVVTDPKGELFIDTADMFRKKGYIVRRLDFINLFKSDGWDCMKSLRTATSVEQIEIIANEFATAVVSNIGATGIYYDGSKLLLQALLLRVALDDSIPDEEKNIIKVFSWLTDPGGPEFLDKLFDKSILPEKLYPCIKPYESVKSSSANLLGNIKTNLSAGINILNTGLIAKILSTDDIDLTLPGKERCAYYIQFPVPNSAYKFPIALFFTMIFRSLMDLASAQDNLKLPVNVDFLLDEFAQCGVLPNWAQLTSVIRSYGLAAFMIVQTSAQFLSNYGDDADTIRSNCAIWLMLGANDLSSAEYFNKRMGKTTVKVHSESRYGIRKLLGMKNAPADKTSEGTGGSELMSTDEIMKLPANHVLVVFQRHNPIFARTVPHFLHPYSKIPEKTLDRNEPDITDEEGRQERRVQERAYFNSYWQEHSIEAPPDNIDDAPYKTEPTFESDFFEVIAEDFAKLKKKKKNGELPEKNNAEKPVKKHPADNQDDLDFDSSDSDWGDIAPAAEASTGSQFTASVPDTGNDLPDSYATGDSGDEKQEDDTSEDIQQDPWDAAMDDIYGDPPEPDYTPNLVEDIPDFGVDVSDSDVYGEEIDPDLLESLNQEPPMAVEFRKPAKISDSAGSTEANESARPDGPTQKKQPPRKKQSAGKSSHVLPPRK